MKIQILISKNSWANKYSNVLKKRLKKYSNNILIVNHHTNLRKNYDINVIFSYFRILTKKYLDRSKFNLVPHESDLPKGKGMSPLTWQLLKKRETIVFSLIEATNKMDAGKIYYKKKVKFKKDILFSEIKLIQFNQNLELIERFISFLKKNKTSPKSNFQSGKSTYFKLRTKKDSKIDINKSLKSQFNLLRLCDFENYPSFFYLNKKKYLIKIIKVK
tara:strand:+ start:983 stop:1633 length:651 start_codon:yes stop_codon:yes gene_type:complete